MHYFTRYFAIAAVLGMLVPSVWAQRDFDAVEIEIVGVAEGVYMLVGMGGNIGLSVGEDGAFLVDDQFAPLTGKILAAIATLTEAPIQFVVNTHFHGDHTGGNENLGKAGAIIVAHENVRSRMSVEQFRESLGSSTPASPPDALPVVTFAEGLTLHWNGDQIRVFHDGIGHAHTDGDAIVHFTQANVFHMGDTYFNGMYPFIDVGSGGDVGGIIQVATRIIHMADGDTKIIPGHGPLSNKAELTAYRDMLRAVTREVHEGIKKGLSLDAIVAQKPTSTFDATWGGGFITPNALVGAIYQSIQGR